MNFTYEYELTKLHEKAAFWAAWPAAILGALLYINEIILSAIYSGAPKALSATIFSLVIMVPMIFAMLIILSSILTWIFGHILFKLAKKMGTGGRKFFVYFVLLISAPFAAWFCDWWLFLSLSNHDRLAHAIWWPIGSFANAWFYFYLFSSSSKYCNNTILNRY